MTDEKTPKYSPEALTMMLAMTVPMQHFHWGTCGHGTVNPIRLKVDLPGRPHNRLDPGYSSQADNEICRDILVPGTNYHGELVFPMEVRKDLEEARMTARASTEAGRAELWVEVVDRLLALEKHRGRGRIGHILEVIEDITS